MNNTENEKKVERLAPDVLQRMLSYSWPGNVLDLGGEEDVTGEGSRGVGIRQF